MSGRYLIWSIEHSAWWRPGSMGYTHSMNEAGIYEGKEAREIVDTANGGGRRFHECMIPVESTWLPEAPKSDEQIVLQLRERARILEELLPDAEPRERRSRVVTMFLRAALTALVEHIGPNMATLSRIVGAESGNAIANRVQELQQSASKN